MSTTNMCLWCPLIWCNHLLTLVWRDPNTMQGIYYGSTWVLSLFWLVWLERNNIIFSEISTSRQALWEDVVISAASWSSKSIFFRHYDVSTIVLNRKVFLQLAFFCMLKKDIFMARFWFCDYCYLDMFISWKTWVVYLVEALFHGIFRVYGESNL